MITTPARSRRLFPRSTGWRAVLCAAVAVGVLLTGAATLLGLLLAGGEAALSALAGGAAVLLLSGTSLLLIDLAERRAPRLTMPLFMAAFVVKVVGLVLLAQQASAPVWMRPGWAVITAAAVVVGWQAAEISAFLRLRVTVEPAADRAGGTGERGAPRRTPGAG